MGVTPVAFLPWEAPRKGAAGGRTKGAAVGVRRGARPSTGRPLVAVLRATVLAATILLATVVAGPAYAATGPQELRLSAPLLSPDRVLTVLATVPATLSGAALPEGSFTASQDGRPVPVTATRVADGPVELVLVLDVSGATLGAEQAAAVDLLRAVPSQTPTTVLPGGDRTTARSAAAAPSRRWGATGSVCGPGTGTGMGTASARRSK